MPNQSTPLSEQVRVVIFGLRNSGKSSFINNLFEKDVSIVSESPGTTTDPVTRSMEILPAGPVAFTDTAGIDDTGELGSLRIKKSLEKLDIADLPVFVSRADRPVSDFEIEIVNSISHKKSLFIVLTFGDMIADKEKIAWAEKYDYTLIDNINKKGFDDFKKLLIKKISKTDFEITPVEGLVNENDLVLLVTPIDLAAPKGRLILPQVETIRDLLDKDCAVLLVKERELKYFYDSLKIKPKLVITDSQAFSKVAADIPEDQPLTSFSILFARKKGDLATFVEGAKHLKNVPEGVKILILESCSHHRQADDIGTVKIPRLFRQLVQSKAEFEFARELPEAGKLKEYFMVINCAGCMVGRNLIMSRLRILKENNVFACNYGLFLAWVNGLLPRVIEPFPMEWEIYNED